MQAAQRTSVDVIPSQKAHPKWALLAASVICWILAGVVWFATSIHFLNGTIQYEGKSKDVDFPFIMGASAPKGRILCQYQLDVPRYHSTQYRFHADDWIVSVRINNIRFPVEEKTIGYGDFAEILDLGPYLHAGQNSIQVEIWNQGGPSSLWIEVAPNDRFRLLDNAIIFVALALTLAFIRKTLNLSAQWGRTSAILILGIALRLLYYQNTPSFLRSYDYDGHLSYIEYILKNAALPDMNSGWETHQPPLYYSISAILAKIGLWLGNGHVSYLHGTLKAEALAASIITLVIGIGIAKLCWPEDYSSNARNLFILATAVFPTLIFQSSRVSNDVLFTLLCFGWLFSLLGFWKTGKKSWLYTTAAILGFGFLTKNSTLILMAISAAVFLFQRSNTVTWKLKHGLFAVLLLAVIAAGYQMRRIERSKTFSSYVVGTIQTLPASYKIDRSIGNILTFNPIAVLQHPVSAPGKAEPRRHKFPEYYFKSAFFGEFRTLPEFDLLRETVLVLGMLLIPFVIIGIIRATVYRDNQDIPMLLTLGGIVLGQMAWVWREPYSFHQDFRFFIVAIAPYLYFLIRGIIGTTPYIQKTGYIVFSFLILNCTILLLLFSFE